MYSVAAIFLYCLFPGQQYAVLSHDSWQQQQVTTPDQPRDHKCKQTMLGLTRCLGAAMFDRQSLLKVFSTSDFFNLHWIYQEVSLSQVERLLYLIATMLNCYMEVPSCREYINSTNSAYICNSGKRFLRMCYEF